jgi:hypothetical protein
MKNLFALSLVIFFFCSNSCKMKKNSANNLNSGKEIKTGEKEQYPEAVIGEFEKSSDPYKILDVSITGNFMEIVVQYGGGCVDLHDFKLIGSPNLAKSLPPQRVIQLVHDNKDDNCKALITKTLKFSVTNLADKKVQGKKVILKFENFEKSVEYTYE